MFYLHFIGYTLTPTHSAIYVQPPIYTDLKPTCKKPWTWQPKGKRYFKHEIQPVTWRLPPPPPIYPVLHPLLYLHLTLCLRALLYLHLPLPAPSPFARHPLLSLKGRKNTASYVIGPLCGRAGKWKNNLSVFCLNLPVASKGLVEALVRKSISVCEQERAGDGGGGGGNSRSSE